MGAWVIQGLPLPKPALRQTYHSHGLQFPATQPWAPTPGPSTCHTDWVSGKKNKQKNPKKTPELSDNKHPSLEGFPNNACCFPVVCACSNTNSRWPTIAMRMLVCQKSLTILTNTLTALFVVNLVKLHLTAFKHRMFNSILHTTLVFLSFSGALWNSRTFN
jgi:hypothetical protein